MRVLLHPSMPDDTIHEYETLLDSSNIRPDDWLKIAAFASPNFPPLGEVGVDIEINWSLLQPVQPEGGLVLEAL